MCFGIMAFLAFAFVSWGLRENQPLIAIFVFFPSGTCPMFSSHPIADELSERIVAAREVKEKSDRGDL